MREVITTKKVYDFGELSRAAKDYAVLKYGQDCSFVDDDFLYFEKRFREYFPVYSCELSAGYRATYGYVKRMDEDWMEEEMSTIRISKWFNKHYPEILTDDYTVTGMYTDYHAEKILKNVLKYRHSYTCVKDIFDDILSDTAWAWEDERNAVCSEEYFSEMAGINEYEFYEDGTMA